MDASEINRAGGPSPGPEASAADTQRRRAALARFLRMGVSDGTKSSSSDMLAMSELETELALLREENAQLKVERHRPADVGHVIERMRSLRLQSPAAQQVGGSPPAGTAQVVAESLAVRDGLMEACQEVQQAMQAIRGRLGALAGEIQGRAGDRGPSGDGLAPSTVEALEPAVVAAETSPELVQSVA